MSSEKKFHIGKNGPAPCNARKRVCRYGDSIHYSTLNEANEKYSLQIEKENLNNIIPSLKKEKILSDKDKALNLFNKIEDSGIFYKDLSGKVSKSDKEIMEELSYLNDDNDEILDMKYLLHSNNITLFEIEKAEADNFNTLSIKYEIEMNISTDLARKELGLEKRKENKYDKSPIRQLELLTNKNKSEAIGQFKNIDELNKAKEKYFYIRELFYDAQLLK